MERPGRDAGEAQGSEPLDHLAGRLVGERDDEDLVGRHDPGRDGVRGPPTDDARLARPGTGEDRHGSARREDGLALGVVQVVEQPRRILGGHEPSMDRPVVLGTYPVAAARGTRNRPIPRVTTPPTRKSPPANTSRIRALASVALASSTDRKKPAGMRMAASGTP